MKTLKTKTASRALLWLALACATDGIAATATITNPPGNTTAWNDTAGNRIKNNCGGMLQDGGTFYWYGWDPTTNTVNCYTSTTLGSASWTKVSNGNFPMFGSGFHGRPDVIKHPTNGTYVMVVEFSSGPGRNGIDYLTSTSPTGPFVSQQQDDFILGGVTMGDKGLYQDDDTAKTAYLLCTTDDGGVNNSTTKIVKLNANYIGQNAIVHSAASPSPKREALAMIKRNGTYYLTSSYTSGWNSSPTSYKTATSINGTYSASWITMPTSPSSTTSFDTQHDYIVKITGSSTTSYFYMGDRWGHQLFPSDPTKFNNNAWYPITFDGSGVPTLQGDASWTINVATGVINGTPQTQTFAATKDAMVKFAAQTTNFGTSNQLQVSGQTNFQKQVFLQFNVQVPAGATITGSSLLVNSQTTGTLRPVLAKSCTDTSWIESGAGGITWSNKPALGSTLATVSTHNSGADSVWNLGTHITVNGNVTIGLDSTFSGDTNFNSREATDPAARPELVVTYQP